MDTQTLLTLVPFFCLCVPEYVYSDRVWELHGTKKHPEIFLQKVFLRPPRVMEFRAFGSGTSAQKTLFFCALSDGQKVFGPGRPPRYPPGSTRDILPKNFMFRLLFPSSESCISQLVLFVYTCFREILA